MSITSPDDRVSEYNPVVATTEFAANFPVFDNDDLTVIHDGVERDDFAVSATYVEGISTDAKVVFAIGITGTVQVVGARDPHRTNRFGNGPLPVRDFNLALDTVEAELQETRRDLDRSFLAPVGESGGRFLAAKNGQWLIRNGEGDIVGSHPPDSAGNMNTAVYDPDGLSLDVYKSENHSFSQAETGAIARSVRTKLRETRSMRDFGAVGDGASDDSSAVAAALSTGKIVDGLGLTYAVGTKPATFLNIRNAAFKVGYVIHASRDYLRTDTAKITNGFLYTAWAQDKAYKIGGQLRVWVNEKEIHTDGTGRIALYFSDDRGATWSFGEYLDAKASGRTLWSAGFDGTNEYLFVRIPSGSTDVPPYTYQMWKRALGSGASQNYNGAWTKTNITFPVPTGFTGQPVMAHGFTVGHEGSIVIGASYAEGSALMRSTNGGTAWTATILATGSSFEEPTVRYISSSGLYVGFMRNGGGGEPRYWVSADNLATIQYYTAPSGYFGGGAMSSSSLCFDIDPVTGHIHGTIAYRNGVLEGSGTDERASGFYITGPAVAAGSFWTAPTTKLYCIGQLPRREPGGASALGQGSVIVDEDKVHLFYGMEERTGVTAGLGKGNRIANIYQTVIFLNDRGSMFDTRADLVANRTSNSQLRKIAGIDAFTLPFNDASNWGPPLISGRPNFLRHTSTLFIAGGVLTLTGTRAGLYVFDTEGSAATDDLDWIIDDDAFDGDKIVLKTWSSTHDVTVKNGTGNINCGADRILNTGSDQIMLMYFVGTWYAFPYADNT
ncbi:hypothetical protein GOB17_33740 [Sinorhizobium meliloti]|uniref:hypothetical protein n=1 Tax=Rhizobium meliloti TaxID=382 RepID=UPI00299EFB07|nr:hypothetical protein [Sinorhizobium meliloti]